jgi:acylphosphatase
MNALHLIIAGRVQGVGFRDWMVGEARARAIAGWVRNRGRDQVEAVICGASPDVDAMLAVCHQGPPAARVLSVEATQTDPVEEPSFRCLPTV